MRKSKSPPEVFPTLLAHQLPKQQGELKWMIESLWVEEAVGIIGGEPKSYKSFLALAMAVAVASGRPCLGKFPVIKTGRVLVFCGEDHQHDVRARLNAIAIASGTSFEQLDIHVITASTVRIDLDKDQTKLENTIAAIKPRFLVLDPFVRLHCIDENKSGEVAPLLGFLRKLQRDYKLAIALVHHAKKGGKKMRGGQALRGTSEFHAWGDSNLYPRRRNKDSEAIILEVEHRNAPAIHGIPLLPEPSGESVALALRGGSIIEDDDEDGEDGEEGGTTTTPNLKDKVLAFLAKATAPVSRNEIRKHCGVRTTTIIAILLELLKEKRIHKRGRGYELVPVGRSKKKRK